ncbi:MAG: hypothetical protein AAFS10_26705, partial [Myxococcota bacterium]
QRRVRLERDCELRGAFSADVVALEHKLRDWSQLEILEGVGDFGGAVMDEWSLKLTQEGNLFGTIQYMPPEYIREERVSSALDIYQMGLILLETLTGRAVIQGEPQLAHIKHLNQTLPIANRLLTSPLRPVILRSLAYTPETRYPHADAMRRELAEIDPSTIPSFEEMPSFLTTMLVDVLRGSGPSSELKAAARPNTNAATEQLRVSQVLDPNAPDPLEERETTLYTPDNIELESGAFAIDIGLPPEDASKLRSALEVTPSQIEEAIRNPLARLAAKDHPLPPVPQESELFRINKAKSSWLSLSFNPFTATLGVCLVFVGFFVGVGLMARDVFLELDSSASARPPTNSEVKPRTSRVLRAGLSPDQQSDDLPDPNAEDFTDVKFIEVTTKPIGADFYQVTARGEIAIEGYPVIFAFSPEDKPITLIARMEGHLDKTTTISSESPVNMTIALPQDNTIPLWRRKANQRRIRERAQAADKRTGSDWIAD